MRRTRRADGRTLDCAVVTTLRMDTDHTALQALQWAWPQLADAGAAPRLFIGAQPLPPGALTLTPQDCCVQPYKPLADALQAQGLRVLSECAADAVAATALVLAPRQRALARVWLAQAVRAAAAGCGRVLAVAHNDAGGRTLEQDLSALAGPLQTLVKHHARVVWTAPLTPAHVQGAALAAALGADVMQRNEEGWWTRVGLFAWDRVDAGSRLLAELLPQDLHGRVADLGAGWGYLACMTLRRCPGITELHACEADARALPALQANLDAEPHAAVRRLHWLDATQPLPLAQPCDAIVCNPPFHRARAADPGLGAAMLASAARALATHGSLWLVANRHLPYETVLRTHFARVAVVTEAEAYKVLHVQQPRA